MNFLLSVTLSCALFIASATPAETVSDPSISQSAFIVTDTQRHERVEGLLVRFSKPVPSLRVGALVPGSRGISRRFNVSLKLDQRVSPQVWRVSLGRPVSVRVAKRISTRLSRRPGIELAEPNLALSVQNMALP